MLGRLRYRAELIRRRLADAYARKAYSAYGQYGEDLIIDRLLAYPATGFYVDVGANDPILYSNTARFYRRGWRGINVEPNPDRAASLQRARPRDINVNAGVGPMSGTMPFYNVRPDVLSTFSRTAADQARTDGYAVAEPIDVAIEPLATLLHSNLPSHTTIDFLSIDVEGFEVDVLQSNDWLRFRPRLVVIEVNRNELPIQDFMLSQGYTDVFGNGLNKIYLPIASQG